MLAILSLVPLPFLKPAWTSGSSWFTYCWSLAWRILSITLLVCEMSAWVLLYYRVRWVQLCGSLSILWHCLSFKLEWKLTFSSPVATAEFSKFAGILSVALSQHHLRIWNSSTGILSPPLALFIVILPKAHWLHIPGCLALGEWSHHLGYLSNEELFCIVLLCILVISS